MTQTVEEANAALRQAVGRRMEAIATGEPSERWYESPSADDIIQRFGREDGESLAVDDARAFRGDALLAETSVHPTSQAFFDLCDRLKDMHRRKSRDYGSPCGDDPLANIRNGAKFVGIPAWKAAMVRLSDKVTRLATFNATGSLHNEGVIDTLEDLASYSLLALLLYLEEQDA